MRTIYELAFGVLVALGAVLWPQQAAVVLLALILLMLQRMARIPRT